jgi:hypothetical protein
LVNLNLDFILNLDRQRIFEIINAYFSVLYIHQWNAVLPVFHLGVHLAQNDLFLGSRDVETATLWLLRFRHLQD